MITACSNLLTIGIGVAKEKWESDNNSNTCKNRLRLEHIKKTTSTPIPPKNMRLRLSTLTQPLWLKQKQLK